MRALWAVLLLVGCSDVSSRDVASRDAGELPSEDAGRAPGEDAGNTTSDGAVATADAGAPDAAALDAGVSGYVFTLPPGFPEPKVPADNPMSAEKVELGRHLFYDKRLSLNGTQACSTCHEQARAFTDGRAQGLGATGQLHPRSPMSLANVAYATTLTWANPLMRELERQALVPLFGENPVELGLVGHEDDVLAALRDDARYRLLFPAAFPAETDPFTFANVANAIASFERTLISGRSRYDRYVNGEADALDARARRGMELFFSEELECFHCHGGFAFTTSVSHVGKPFDEVAFHNDGLYNIGGMGAYPPDNQGLFDFTGEPKDMGRFKAPTLRNVAVTAPYMHDGSIATLSEVIDHYRVGGRTITDGPYAGVGALSPYKSGFLFGFAITEDDRASLIAFLESLTDELFLRDPTLSDPWAAAP